MTRAIFSFVLVLLLNAVQLHAEGSVDFINYPGHRLFLRADKNQQIKAYAEAGEFLNFGASHIGINGGTITVYRPDGSLYQVYDGSNGDEAIIYDSTQELNGPIGTAANGYAPGIIPVTSATQGIWSFVLKFAEPSNGAAYQNLLNNAPWTRALNQPTNRRVILSWDVTVSKNNPSPNGGVNQSGRVFTNEYNSMISQNGTTTSPRFYVLTSDGLQYSMDFTETDPFGFPISSSSLGLLNADQSATYKSWPEDALTRSDDPTTWTEGNIYQYDPQAEDRGDLINNKIFFNIPDPTMPLQAVTTDIFHSNTHTTWLYREPTPFTTIFNSFSAVGVDEVGADCFVGDMQVGQGANFIFDTNSPGRIQLKLDINNDGDVDDDVDVVLTGLVDTGIDSIFWDGNDGLGNPIPTQDGFSFNYAYELRGGENHILLSDVENNTGGISFELLSNIGAFATDNFYYDHTEVDGPISGNSTTGTAWPTNIPFTYDALFGNKKMLDYWAYVVYEDTNAGVITVDITEDCTPVVQPDSDGDGIDDTVDLDDDNDGIADLMEHCLGQGFACLPNGLDPSGDNDGDGIANYQDADDVAVNNTCQDVNTDGICDDLAAIYDTDADGVPDHLDLDSDNDGISDLYEANHNQLDVDNDGVLDGENAAFGANGFFNILASDSDAFDAVSVYQPLDQDGDGIMDADDLDSDNDGINDVEEAGHADLDDDGLIDNSPVNVNTYGIAISLNSSLPIPLDTDDDNLPDFHDLDSDNDGINDVVEGGNSDDDNDGIIGTGTPIVNNKGQANGATSNPSDTDEDTVSDYRDLDSDNDGINDVIEGGNPDEDNDGIIGTGIPIVNEDGQANGATSNPDDTDNDNIPDYHDLDSDNDGINDVIEGGNTDEDNDGIIGTDNPIINDNGQANGATSNPDDTDGDNIPDYHDLDSDNDGINDVVEGGNPDEDNDGIVGTGTPIVNHNGQANEATSNPDDTDGDNIPDYHDLDSDNDGINDVTEGGNPDDDNDGIIGTGTPIVNNDGQANGATSNPNDQDGDNIPDYHDLDSDNDGINDVVEGGNTDEDNDGIIGNGTPVVNVNGQANDATSNPQDTDSDNIPDYHDLDSDNDGINDVVEGGNPDGDNDGIIGSGTLLVNVNGQANGTTSNPDDTDGDNIPDYHDLDSDNDGINDVVEGGNPDEDNDGIIGNGTPIVNEDGQANGATSNPQDTDSDNIPDYHDLDSDNDGINDVIEGGNSDEDNDGIVGTGTPIVNDDGQANGATSNPQDTDGDTIPDYHDLDSDNDGINDVVEGGNPDGDNDGIIGSGNPTVNQDGQANGATSNPDDTDGDNVPDYHDLDSDNDGINDVVEGGNPDEDNDGIIGTGTPIVNEDGQANGATSNPDDTDGDNIPDYHDLDSDNDGINDVVEGGNEDTDNDGIIGTGTPIVNEDGQANGATSNPNDQDGDNIPDYHDLDSDNDGINDVEEGGNEDPDNDGVVGIGIPDVNDMGQPDGSTSNPTDTNMNGIPDYHDLDSDSDDILDVVEGGNDDPDGDGIVGTGTPIVNDMGQTNGSTSTPPDSDLDGTPDYQEPACNGADISILTSNGGGDYCEGDVVNLTATTNITTGVLNYVWTRNNVSVSSGQATNDTDLTLAISPVNANASGSYILTATTEEGCVATSEIIIVNVTTTPTQPAVAVNDDALCAGEELTILTAEYIGQNVVYQWFMTGTNGQQTIDSTSIPTLVIENVTTDNAGEYFVIVSDGNCASTPSPSVSVSVTDAITDITATNNSSAGNDICTDSELVLSIPAFDNATVEWFGPNGSVGTDFEVTLTGLTADDAGEYYAVVTFDVCGVVNSTPTTVFISDNNITPVLAADNNEICANESVELSVVNDLNIEAGDIVIYSWYNELNELIETTTENSILLENLTESGEFYGSVSVNGCATTPSAPVAVNVTQVITDITATNNSSADNAICIGGELVLSIPSSDNATVEWFSPNGLVGTGFEVILSDAIAGEYYAVITLPGCGAINSTPTTVFISDNDITPILAADNNEICSNESVELSVVNDLNIEAGDVVIYTWYNELDELIGTTTENSLLLEDLTESEEFYVSVSINGCSAAPSASVSINVTETVTDITATNNSSADNAICTGGELVLSIPTFENTTVEWFGPNGSIGTDFEVTLTDVTAEDAGEYYAVVTFEVCGAITSAPTTVFISDNNVTPILAADNDEICANESAELSIVNDLNTDAGDVVIYSWYNELDELIETTTEHSILLENLTESEEFYVSVSINGCSVNSENYFINVNILPNETANIPLDELYLCAGETPALQAIASVESTGFWTSIGTAVVLNPADNVTTATLLEDGANLFVWTLQDEICGAFSSDTLTIYVEANAQVFDDLYTTEQNETTFGDVSSNDNFVGGDNYEFAVLNAPAEGTLTFNSNGTFEYTPSENFVGVAQFDYTLCNLNCPDDCLTANVTINYQNTDFTDDCFVPNGITPNGDGANDALEIPCLNNDAHPNNHIMIFNRWGDKVYEENSYANDWFGTYKDNQLPAGTYFYILMIEPGTEPIQDFFSIIY